MSPEEFARIEADLRNGTNQRDLPASADMLMLEVKVLRGKLALIEVTVALWEAGAVEFYAQADRVGTDDIDWFHELHEKGDVNRAHAKQITSILKGE